MRIDKDNIKIILILLVVALGIGYSYLNTELNINGTANINSANWDIHWANIQVTNGSVSGTNVVTAPTISNSTTVNYSIILDKPGDYYEFTVDAVNAGTLDAMIESIDSKLNGTTITTLPAYLDYDVTYSDGTALATNQELLHDSTETYKVRIAYKDDISASDLPETNQSLSLQFSVTYKQADESAVAVVNPISFSTDSWSTIVSAVKRGKTENYNVGDTKTVDMGGLGTHTLRIANMSTPTECSQEGFSQTACGFVLEFVEFITTHVMNSTYTNVGGWPASEMRTYVNSDIYNALPSELRDGIIDTSVASGHGTTEGETNFTSTDRIYLLSAVELWGDNDYSSFDTTTNLSRQFDYYNNIGVDSNNYINAHKGASPNTSNYTYWWLRSADASNNGFARVVGDGTRGFASASREHGVAPAFRIG